MRITKNYLYLLILLSLKFSGDTFAQSELPDYCRFYPKFVDGEKVSQEIHKDDHLVKSAPECFDSELVEFNLGELSAAVQNVEEKTLDQIGENLQHKLSYHAVKQVLEKKSEYYGLFNYLDSTPSEDLIECGKSHSHYKDKISPYEKYFSPKVYNPKVGKVILEATKKQSTEIDYEKQRDFLALNVINGIKAAALFDINKDHYENVSDAESEFTSSYVACHSICSAKDAMIINSCYKLEADCSSKARKLRDERLSIYEKKVTPLYDMVATSPLLFSNADEGEVLSSFGSDELKESPFQKKITSMIPNKEIRRVKSLLQNNDEEGLRSFFTDKAGLINNILDDKENYRWLRYEARKELKKEYARLDLAAEKSCKGEGENLHHYPHLVEAAFDDMYSNSLSKDILKHQMRVGQAGYCHLLNQSPYEENKVSPASIGAFALLGIGGALQLIPGPGTVVGSGLMIAGGAILTGVGVLDTIDSNNRLNTDIGMHSVGYGGYQKILDSKDARDANVYWSATDIILLPIDLHGLRALKAEKAGASSSRRQNDQDLATGSKENRKGARRYDFEQRKAIDEIEEELADDYKRLIRKYNPDNIHELSHGDSIYFAGVADMIEKDLIKANPKLAKSPKKLKKEMNKQLEDIINDCKGKSKK